MGETGPEKGREREKIAKGPREEDATHEIQKQATATGRLLRCVCATAGRCELGLRLRCAGGDVIGEGLALAQGQAGNEREGKADGLVRMDKSGLCGFFNRAEPSASRIPYVARRSPRCWAPAGGLFRAAIPRPVPASGPSLQPLSLSSLHSRPYSPPTHVHILVHLSRPDTTVLSSATLIRLNPCSRLISIGLGPPLRPPMPTTARPPLLIQC